MLSTNFDTISKQAAIGQVLVTRTLCQWLIQCINSCSELLHKSTIYKLMNLKLAPAMRALLPLLGKPLPDTVSAAKL